MPGPQPYPDATLLSLYEGLIDNIAGLERKGAKTPYTSVNGNMFSFLTPEGELALRLSPAQRTAFLDAHKDSVLEQHGVVLKEYVRVPQSLLDDQKELTELFAASYDYAQGLKPKPTKRPAK